MVEWFLYYLLIWSMTQIIAFLSYLLICWLINSSLDGSSKKGTILNTILSNMIKYCQARLLLLFAQKLQIQLNSEKKEQSWRYNPNAPTTTTTTPQLFKAGRRLVFTLFQLTNYMRNISMTFWINFTNSEYAQNSCIILLNV